MKEHEPINNGKQNTGLADQDELQFEFEHDREMAMWRYERGLDADSTRIGI